MVYARKQEDTDMHAIIIAGIGLVVVLASTVCSCLVIAARFDKAMEQEHD